MKYVYCVFNRSINGKNIAVMAKCPESLNLLSVMHGIPDAWSLNVYSTQKRAREVRDGFNKGYHDNGTLCTDAMYIDD